ncbi:hypothetical protein AB0H43_11705 [Hamadaea sp. NPDC050747]|uniref:hypothetical protein n=1 Tax=Hamadaea sp. NPDC050747 TaxID=3155789 RepID=UPI0033FE9541
MMIDYNVSEHWAEDEPDWLKSLVSSLDRRHGTSTVLPLTLIVEEIVKWVDLASGPDAWKKIDNRESLKLDLAEAVEATGIRLRQYVSRPLRAFQAAFARLVSSPKDVLQQAPGTRTAHVWTEVLATGSSLLTALDADEAARASWDDLVATAQDRTLARRRYRPIAELLFAQLRRRGLDAETAFRDLVSMIAFGRAPGESRLEQTRKPVAERLANARVHVGTPARIEPIVVWLGYLGRVSPHLRAGRVMFLDAHWAVPNADPDGQDFEHRAELHELVRQGNLFTVAKMIDDESDVDFLVRVDLGETTAAGAVRRAVDIVTLILDVSIHNAGGIRPHHAQYGVLRSGQAVSFGFLGPRVDGFPEDHYGAEITRDAIEEHGPRIAEALAREEFPRFLAAALEVQTAADHPFSRDMALRQPSEADVSSVIPLADRVVQHVASHAALDPNDLFDQLGERWPHVRWLTDVRRAADMCLVSAGRQGDLHSELIREWLSDRPKQPWLLLVADRADDFLSLCRVEHERAWIARMFASVSDLDQYSVLVDEYRAEGVVLDARRRRVRNALVHGNPVNFAVVASVREYARFLSGTALNLALDSYVEGTEPAAALATRTDEFLGMQAGKDAANYWRARVAADTQAR